MTNSIACKWPISNSKNTDARQPATHNTLQHSPAEQGRCSCRRAVWAWSSDGETQHTLEQTCGRTWGSSPRYPLNQHPVGPAHVPGFLSSTLHSVLGVMLFHTTPWPFLGVHSSTPLYAHFLAYIQLCCELPLHCFCCLLCHYKSELRRLTAKKSQIIKPTSMSGGQFTWRPGLLGEPGLTNACLPLEWMRWRWTNSSAGGSVQKWSAVFILV